MASEYVCTVPEFVSLVCYFAGVSLELTFLFVSFECLP